MRTHGTVLPKSARITWRRHFPVWVGLEGRIRDGSVVGVYVRVGDRMRFFSSERRLRAAHEKVVSSRRRGLISSRR